MRRVSILLLSVIAYTATPAIAAPEANVRFGTRTVTASAFSPGAQILFFGVAKIPLTYYSRLQRFQFVTSASSDGTATAQTDFDIPVTSVWVVADLRTGQVSIASPRPRGVATVPVGRSAIRGNSDQFSFDRSFLDLLYVHAGEGAWVWHAADGGDGDRDGPNGMTTVDASRATRVAGAAVPSVFSPGGTLVAIDSEDLVVLTSDVQALLPGASR